MTGHSLIEKNSSSLWHERNETLCSYRKIINIEVETKIENCCLKNRNHIVADSVVSSNIEKLLKYRNRIVEDSSILKY